MRELIDIVMTTLFVFFMIFLVRGFMLQAKEKNRGEN